MYHLKGGRTNWHRPRKSCSLQGEKLTGEIRLRLSAPARVLTADANYKTPSGCEPVQPGKVSRSALEAGQTRDGLLKLLYQFQLPEHQPSDAVFNGYF